MQKNNIWEIFRGIAALLVMFHHYTERYDGAFGHVEDWPVQSVYGGQFGVCMFFIFTGMFLMPSLMKADNFGSYLKKRALRLYPYYIPCVIITFLCMSITPPLTDRYASWGDFVANLTMFQSYFGFRHVDGAYWTLSVQLMVYILMGGLFFLLRKRRILFLNAIIIWLVLDTILSLCRVYTGSIPFSSILLVPTIHLFVQGLLVWFISTEENNFYKHLSQIVLLISPLYSLFNFSLYYTVFNFFILGLIYLITIKKWTYKRRNFLTFLGSISFPMYLLHQNIGFLIIRYIESIGLTHEFFIIIPIVFIVLLSWLVSYCVEHLIISSLCKIKKLV